jgi:hypothetical protein
MTPVSGHRHPHAYTLELLRIAIEHLPPTFSEAKRKTFAKRLERYLGDRKVPYEELQDTISELGKESWAYRKAYEDMYSRYGRASEEAHLLENLDRGVREKYEQFIHEGGKIGYIAAAKPLDAMMKPSPFERYFTPEEKFAVEQALLAALDAARKEIDGLVLDKKKEEYASSVKDYKTRRRVIESKIDELKLLAGVSQEWRSSIEDRVRTIEEGWSIVEQGLDVPMLDREIEHWKGMLGSFLHEA